MPEDVAPLACGHRPIRDPSALRGAAPRRAFPFPGRLPAAVLNRNGSGPAHDPRSARGWIMTEKRRSSTRLRVEALEKRETPSISASPSVVARESFGQTTIGDLP